MEIYSCKMQCTHPSLAFFSSVTLSCNSKRFVIQDFSSLNPCWLFLKSFLLLPYIVWLSLGKVCSLALSLWLLSYWDYNSCLYRYLTIVPQTLIFLASESDRASAPSRRPYGDTSGPVAFVSRSNQKLFFCIAFSLLCVRFLPVGVSFLCDPLLLSLFTLRKTLSIVCSPPPNFLVTFC